MADDKSMTGEPDRSRISLAETYEVEYWTDNFGVTVDRLKAAVKAVGSSPDAVEEWLRQNS